MAQITINHNSISGSGNSMSGSVSASPLSFGTNNRTLITPEINYNYGPSGTSGGLKISTTTPILNSTVELTTSISNMNGNLGCGIGIKY